MSKFTETDKAIYTYLIGERDYDMGLILLAKYERRKHFVRIMQSRADNTSSKKLHYALLRLTNLPETVLYQKKKILELEDIQNPVIESGSGGEGTGSGSGSSDDEDSITGSGSGSPSKEKGSGSGGEVTGSGSSGAVKQSAPDVGGAVTGSGSGGSDESKGKLPELITKIKSELAEQVKVRSKFKTALTEIGDKNDPKSIQQRKSLGEQIIKLSARIDFLVNTKEDFFKTRILPNPELVYPTEKKITAGDLYKMERNLITSLTKSRNQLLYQSLTKQENQNPMPEGPKRKKLEQKVKEKETELTDVRTKLKSIK